MIFEYKTNTKGGLTRFRVGVKIPTMRCRKCRSRRVIKVGFKTTKDGRLQRYQCNACGYVWIVRPKENK